MDLDNVSNLTDALKQEMRKVIVGQDMALDLLLVALLSNGHILIEGVPGTAKTLMARAFSAALSLKMGRIQFTPDMMPGDILGTSIFDFRTNEFHLTKGPIFTEILLGDEINRTPPKTQAALLQAMHERTATIDGTTYDLGEGFMVLATQNPIEHQGTYPLPEAQLDRFLFNHILDYPTAEEEYAIVEMHGHRSLMPDVEKLGIQPVAGLDEIVAIRNYIRDLRVAPEIIRYVVDIIRATRESPSLQFGASPRAATMMTAASKAYAAMQGRDFVIPDDIKMLAPSCLRHRIVLSPSAEIEGQTADEIVARTIEGISAPR